MANPLSAAETLDREFLELRAQLLSLAASFDRLDRGAGDVHDDPRWQRLCAALQIVQQTEPGRAQRLQMLFSLPYRETWRAEYQLEPGPQDSP